MTKAEVTSKTVAIKHIKIRSAKTFLLTPVDQPSFER